jgi:hypothetical protein
MRRFWLAIGVALGALIVWSLHHEARKALAKANRDPREALRESVKYDQMEWAMRSAIDGIDYLDPDWWESEIEKWQNVPDDYDGEELD